MHSDDVDALLSQIDVGEVWGVGHQIGDRLRGTRIDSAQKLRSASPKAMREQFGVVMERTCNALRGMSCLALEDISSYYQHTRPGLSNNRFRSWFLSLTRSNLNRLGAPLWPNDSTIERTAWRIRALECDFSVVHMCCESNDSRRYSRTKPRLSRGRIDRNVYRDHTPAVGWCRRSDINRGGTGWRSRHTAPCLRTFRGQIAINPELWGGSTLSDPEPSFCHEPLLLLRNIRPNYTATRATEINATVVFELSHVFAGEKAPVVALIHRLVALKGVENVRWQGESLLQVRLS